MSSANLTMPANPVKASREIAASPERVYAAFTQADLLKQWYAPEGWELPRCTIDPRVGGLFHYNMKGDGMDVWGRSIILRIEPNRLLEYTDSFSNEAGDIIDPASIGMAADYPREALVRVEIEPTASGSQVTVSHGVTPEMDEYDSMQTAWGQMLDRLNSLLTS